jgi:succinate dehydrogenase hydrophobic anchor subunit
MLFQQMFASSAGFVEAVRQLLEDTFYQVFSFLPLYLLIVHSDNFYRTHFEQMSASNTSFFLRRTHFEQMSAYTSFFKKKKEKIGASSRGKEKKLAPHGG